MKRTTYTLLVVAIVAVIFAVGYWFRYQGGVILDLNQSTSTTGSLPSGSNNFPSNNIPSSITQTIPTPGGQTPTLGLVAQNPVEAYFVDAQNNVTLIQPDGQIAAVNAGQVTNLSSQTIDSLRRAFFSYDGRKIIAIFGDAINPQVSVFDTGERAWHPLNLNIQDAAWSPGNYEIAYWVEASSSSVLNILNLADPKAKPQPLLNIHVQDVTIRWPNSNQIIFESIASGMTNGSTWSYDLKKKSLTLINADEPGLSSLWDPTGSVGALFTAGPGGNGGTLKTINALGNTGRIINFLTLPEKCVFNSRPTTITQINTPVVSGPSTTTTATTTTSTPKLVSLPALDCGVPHNDSTMRSELLPDAYRQGAIFTSDDFYEVSLMTGSVQKLYTPNFPLDAVNLKTMNGILFFVNRLDERLYALSLPPPQ